MRNRLSVFSPLNIWNDDPFAMFREMEKQMQQWGSLSDQTEAKQDFTPNVASREGDYAYHIDVDLPGVCKDDIRVEIKDHTLTISGERKHKEETKKDGVYHYESEYGKFSRRFSLPENIDEENIQASSKDGVLEVVLPKIARLEETKKISVA